MLIFCLNIKELYYFWIPVPKHQSKESLSNNTWKMAVLGWDFILRVLLSTILLIPKIGIGIMNNF